MVFAVHPRTAQRLQSAGVPVGKIRMLGPIRYLEMVDLIADARVVVTDSGGLQEETTALGIALPDGARKYGASDHGDRGNESALFPIRRNSEPPRSESCRAARATARGLGRRRRRTHRSRADCARRACRFGSATLIAVP